MTKLFFSAGDVSGDIHLAMLARETLSRHPDWTIHALGGAQMQAAGAQMLGDTSGMGVIGFASALAILPRVLKLQRQTLRWLRNHRVEGAVLCDWGAFNARLLPALRALNIPVLYYFPPRSWQKHGEGGVGIAPLVNRVATPFEWSAQRLREAGCQAEWVGHPLLETTRPSRPRSELRREFGVTESDQILIALMPGSRDLELKLIAPQIAQAVQILRNDDSNLKFVIAMPPGAAGRALKYFGIGTPIVEGRSSDALIACDAAIVKSGTSTLEAAVADAPQIVVYDVPPLLRAQWKWTGMSRRVPFVAMPNIILDRGVVPELLGDECRAPCIAREMIALLSEPEQCAAMREGYTAVRRALGSELTTNATSHTAQILEAMLNNQRRNNSAP